MIPFKTLTNVGCAICLNVYVSSINKPNSDSYSVCIMCSKLLSWNACVPSQCGKVISNANTIILLQIKSVLDRWLQM